MVAVYLEAGQHTEVEQITATGGGTLPGSQPVAVIYDPTNLTKQEAYVILTRIRDRLIQLPNEPPATPA